MKKIKEIAKKIGDWYDSLTSDLKTKDGGLIRYSLSDTENFWSMVFILLSFPFVISSVFYCKIAGWQEFAVYAVIMLMVMAYKAMKQIALSYKDMKINMIQSQSNESGENND